MPDDNPSTKSAVVAFHIPQVGIQFKAPFAAADPIHSDLASLLALLEFIDSNQKYFSNHTYQIYSNNLHVVNFLNDREATPEMFEPLLDQAREYRERYRFSIDWIPARDNPLYEDLLD